MSAATAAMRDACSAFAAFLRGFVGVVRVTDRAGACLHPHRTTDEPGTRDSRPTAASVRAALAERAAGRRSCC